MDLSGGIEVVQRLLKQRTARGLCGGWLNQEISCVEGDKSRNRDIVVQFSSRHLVSRYLWRREVTWDTCCHEEKRDILGDDSMKQRWKKKKKGSCSSQQMRDEDSCIFLSVQRCRLHVGSNFVSKSTRSWPGAAHAGFLWETRHVLFPVALFLEKSDQSFGMFSVLLTCNAFV